MQGVILAAGSDRNLILGDDAFRYTFALGEWRDAVPQPIAGMRVNFEIQGSRAVDVRPISDTDTGPAMTPQRQRTSAPSPSASGDMQDALAVQIAELERRLIARIDNARNDTDTEPARTPRRQRRSTPSPSTSPDLVARIAELERRLIARIDNARRVTVTEVKMPFGSLFTLFFKAMPPYLLALLTWIVLIGVTVGLLIGIVVVATLS